MTDAGHTDSSEDNSPTPAQPVEMPPAVPAAIPEKTDTPPADDSDHESPTPDERKGETPEPTVRASSRGPIAAASALLLLALVGIVSSFPIQIYGDGIGYLGMAASIVKDVNLVFDDQDLLYAARWGEPETLLPYSENGFLTKENRNGVLEWGTHSFYYPLLVAPFLMLFGVKGAVLLNILLFVTIFALLARALADVAPNPIAGVAGALALLLCSPLLSYVFWVHTEICLFSAVCASFLALYGGRPVLGAALLGWAAAQKPPLAAVFGLFALWIIVRDRAYRRVLFAGVAMAVVMAPQLMYNLWAFGSLSSFGSYVDPGLISAERIFTFWLGPGRGMIWFFPLLCWCIVRSSKPWWWTCACAAIALLVSVGSCVITVFYGHEVGIRYAVYIYPLFLVLLPAWKFGKVDMAALGVALFLSGGLLLNPLGNLATWHVYPNPYPSRLLVNTGVPLYPETIQQVNFRMAREVAADYLDDGQRPRKETVRLMAKRLRDPEAVVKVYGEPAARISAETVVSLQIEGEKAVTQPLRPNRVTTLYAQTSPEQLRSTTMPNIEPLSGDGDGKISIMHMALKTPLYRAGIGKGRLRWTGLSRPDEPMVDNYVYQMGPFVIGVYPGRSWLVETMASEDLAAHGLVANQFNAISPDGAIGHAEIVAGAAVEGTHYARLSIEGQSAGQTIDFSTGSAPLALGPAFENRIEVVGWFRCTGLEAWRLAARFGGADAPGEAVTVFQGGAAGGWMLFRGLIDVPTGATDIKLAISLTGAQGSLYLDDVLVTKWWDPWR